MENNTKKAKWNTMDVLEMIRDILIILTISCFAIAGIAAIKQSIDKKRNREETDELRRRVAAAAEIIESVSDNVADTEITEAGEDEETAVISGIPKPVILAGYQDLYADNSDLAGWIRIEDTKIDYPVMQTFGDNGWYYLDKSFSRSKNSNGSLFADPDCVIGSGTKKYDYQDGTRPSTNMIIYGHRMNNGDMLGGLGKYLDKDYGLSHNVISFDSLYEHRKFELIAVFKSKIFYTDEDVFKYYQFTQAATKEEFDASYQSIKDLAVYDTGVEAQWGDEFITLSTCDRWTSNGRLVVVGKRIE